MINELLNPLSQEEYLQLTLNRLRAAGWPVDDWVPGSIQRTMMESFALGLHFLDHNVSDLARGGYLATATGKWLDALAESHYGLSRQPSTFTQGRITLTAEDGSGPYELERGLWFGTPDGLRFQSTSAAIVPLGGSVTVPIRAERPGSDYNVAVGSIAIMHTPLSGVNASNPENWITSAGVDVETDESLRSRCRLRWIDLGQGRRDAYLLWALTSHPSVTKARILDQHPRGQGTVDVILWGDGGIGPEVVTAVNTRIQELRPISDDVDVYAAEPVTINVAATLTVPVNSLEDAQAEVAASLNQLQQDLDIGQMLYRAVLIDKLMDGTGVTNAVLTTPAADVALDSSEVAQLAPDLTWVTV